MLILKRNYLPQTLKGKGNYLSVKAIFFVRTWDKFCGRYIIILYYAFVAKILASN
jgi:hypothetical protein